MYHHTGKVAMASNGFCIRRVLRIIEGAGRNQGPDHMGLKRMHRIIGTGLSVAIPVLYMVSAHIRWMPDPNAKKRMALKHAGFWGGLAATIFTTHRFGFRAKSLGKAAAIF